MRPTARFGEHTPPAIFSLILGLFGLTLAWRQAAAAGLVPGAISELLLGLVTGFFAVAATSYALKFMRRPGVLMEDLRILPGRGGLAAMAVCVSALSTGLIPISTGAATALMWIALGFHIVMTGLVAYTLATGAEEQRQVTPIWHLSFVGVIVTAVSAVTLGYYVLAAAIFWITLALALVIYAVSAVQLLRRTPPEPLRPMLAIHLAPPSLFATVALGFPPDAFPIMSLLAKIALAAAALIGVGLLANMRFITKAGFSPLWASFTFPVSAFAGALLAFARVEQGQFALALGALVLAGASVLVPYVAFKVIRMWINGQLALKTNAARV